MYESMEGQKVDPQGWIDVAVSMFGDRVRIIMEDSGGDARLALNIEGLEELERRIAEAKEQMLKRNLWER